MEKEKKVVDEKYFELVGEIINEFNYYYPDVKLDNLENLRFKEGTYHDRTVEYDMDEHLISIDKRIKKSDLKYKLTREIVGVIATNRKIDVTGLNAPGVSYDSIGYGISEGVKELISKTISKSEDMKYFSTGVLTNLIMNITSSEMVIEAYFENDSNRLINELGEKLGSKSDAIMLLKAISSEAKNSLNNYSDSVSILGEIEFSLLSKYLDNNKIGKEKVEELERILVTNSTIMESDKFESVNDVQTLLNREKRKLDLEEMVSDISSVVGVLRGEENENRSSL